jgi:hypothetical protein
LPISSGSIIRQIWPGSTVDVFWADLRLLAGVNVIVT